MSCREARASRKCFRLRDSVATPNAFWTPLWGYFEAVYDDYGRVKLLDSEVARRRLVAFFASLVEIEVAANAELAEEYGEPATLSAFLETLAPAVAALVARVNAEPAEPGTRVEKLSSTFDYSKRPSKASLRGKKLWEELCAAWEYLWDHAQEGCLYVDRRETVFTPVQFCVLHGVAADYLIGWLEGQKTQKGASLKRRNQFDRALKEAKSLTELRAEAPARKKRRPADEDPVVSGNFMAWLDFRKVVEFVGEFEGTTYHEEHELKPLVAAYADKVVTEDELFAEVRPMMDARYIMIALESMNLRITPIVSTGQDYDNELGRAFAKFIRTTSAGISRQRKALRD